MLVGLTGAAGCGKDTAANALVDIMGFTRASFATIIKECINTLLDESMSRWNDREWKEAPIVNLGKSPRQLAQTLGTEWGRKSVHSDIWIMALDTRMGSKIETDHNIVITDVRFDNEAEWIINEGGIVIEITRAELPSVSAHSSEDGVKQANIYASVANSSTIRALECRIRAEVLLAQAYNEDA